MLHAKVNNSVYIEITGTPENRFLDQQEFFLDIVKADENYFHIIRDNKSYKAQIIEVNHQQKLYLLKINGVNYTVSLKDKFDLLLEKMGFNNSASNDVKDIKAPMPGLIIEIKVKEGSEVKKGDPLMILEAMKMENILKSPGEGVIRSIKVKAGNSVEKNQVLIQF